VIFFFAPSSIGWEERTGYCSTNASPNSFIRDNTFLKVSLLAKVGGDFLPGTAGRGWREHRTKVSDAHRPNKRQGAPIQRESVPTSMARMRHSTPHSW
jgi:hypothetical protein